MSTRSYIGIENNDGSVDFVYCHWDGYPTGVGADVIDLDRRRTRKLVNGGDMSKVGEPYSLRGEKCPMRTCASRQAYMEKLNESDCDYAYLKTRSGAWLWAYPHSGKFFSLRQELAHDADPR